MSHELAINVGFTPDDLSANRKGYLSATQKAELGRRRMRLDSSLVLILVLTITLLVTAYRGQVAQEATSAQIIVLILAIGACGGGLAAYFAMRFFPIHRDLQNQEVGTVTGTVHLSTEKITQND